MELNEIQQQILTFLYKHYPDLVASEKIIQELKIEKEDVRKDIVFLEEEFLIETTKFLGGNFLAKLTSHGRKAVNEFVTSSLEIEEVNKKPR